MRDCVSASRLFAFIGVYLWLNSVLDSWDKVSGRADLNIRLLIVLTVLVHLSFAGCRFIISLTAIHHGATPFTVGVVMSLLTVIAMLFAVRWGRWVDHVGVRVPMLAGASAILAAMVLAWAVPSLGTLFAVSPLAGSGFFLFHIAAGQAAAVIGRPEDRVRNFGLLALAFSTSGFLGPVLAGFAIDGIDHRGAMLALSFGALVNVIALAARNADIPHQASAAAAPQEKRRIADFLRIPGFRLVFIVSGALSMTWELFAFVIPIHGSRSGSAPPPSASYSAPSARRCSSSGSCCRSSRTAWTSGAC